MIALIKKVLSRPSGPGSIILLEIAERPLIRYSLLGAQKKDWLFISMTPMEELSFAEGDTLEIEENDFVFNEERGMINNA